VLSERPPDRTTSAAAGASWGPYLVNEARELDWSRVTLKKLCALAETPGTGVRLISGTEVSEKAAPPEWVTQIDGYEPCTADELQRYQPLYGEDDGAAPALYRSGWHYTVPLLDMPAYLGYLVRRLRAAGGTFDFGRRVESFDEVRKEAGCLINCTGIGARELVPDKALYPTRGQLLVVSNPGIDRFFQDDGHGEDLTYIYPHGDRVVLGGCATDHDESYRPRQSTAERILERCIKIMPELSRAELIEHRVGLRPSREKVRLERAELDGVPLIHNYGHGAVGVSLSWGCAEAVADLIN